MLILLNAGLAAIQFFVVAPLAATYYGEPVISEMLRWQSLIYLSTPFLILPEAMLTRNLDFKKPAIVNLTSAFVGAAVALGMAYGNYGVWTLVFAPIAIFWTRAVALMIATRFWITPSFNFTGAGGIFSFGTAMLIAHGFWIIQSQGDIFIAGRAFDNHDLGLYAEALFLTQIFAAKFVPPLNEVAFPAYARLQNDRAALASGFLKAVRLIMLISCPLYLGMAVTAPCACVDNAAAALAQRRASGHGVCRASAAASAPVNVSPAPMVSVPADRSARRHPGNGALTPRRFLFPCIGMGSVPDAGLARGGRPAHDQVVRGVGVNGPEACSTRRHPGRTRGH